VKCEQEYLRIKYIFTLSSDAKKEWGSEEKKEDKEKEIMIFCLSKNINTI